MKTLTVRLSEVLVAQIEEESRERKISKSDVAHERLSGGGPRPGRSASLHAVADLIGCLDRLPPDLSRRKKAFLRTTGNGRKRSR